MAFAAPYGQACGTQTHYPILCGKLTPHIILPKFLRKRMPCLLQSRGSFSEFSGLGIGSSPQEFLGAGCRSHGPADPSRFKSRFPSGVPKLLPKNTVKSEISIQHQSSIKEQAFFIHGARCTGDRFSWRAYLTHLSRRICRSKFYVFIHIHYRPVY